MSRSELPPQDNPYAHLPLGKKRIQASLEIPTGLMSIARRIQRNEQDVEYVHNIILQGLTGLDDTSKDQLGSNPGEVTYIGLGFESEIYSFKTDARKWVVKIALPKSFSAGMLKGDTNEYADMLKWNLKTLQEAYDERLPHLLPSPYLIVAPREYNGPSTLQIAPFIDQIKDVTELDHNQRHALIRERLKFEAISKRLHTNKKVFPDPITYNNLIIGTVHEDPHLVLWDIGLYNLHAPTPVRNMLATPIRQFSLYMDIRHLKSE